MAPYKADGSASPRERQQTQSPEPGVGRHAAGPSRGGHRDSSNSGPSKRPKLTQSDFQRIQLEKLLANPEREVALPEPIREKTLRAPHEMMKNVQGSAAGAGSGEFHVYKASRRREYERVKLMEDKGRALEDQQAFQARQEERDAITDAKTARNRAKRQKRKGGGKKDGEKATNGNGGADGQKAAQGVKRKLAGGAEGFTVPRAGDDGSGDEDEEEQRGGAVIGGTGSSRAIPSDGGVLGGPQAAARRGDEPTVVIHDDD